MVHFFIYFCLRFFVTFLSCSSFLWEAACLRPPSPSLPPPLRQAGKPHEIRPLFWRCFSIMQCLCVGCAMHFKKTYLSMKWLGSRWVVKSSNWKDIYTYILLRKAFLEGSISASILPRKGHLNKRAPVLKKDTILH